MESNFVNVIPEWITPIYHASQGDDGRVVRLGLCDGAVVYTLSGTEALRLRYRKPDGTINSIGVANTADNYVDITVPADMTDIVGLVFCKLRINSIGAKAFYLAIEKEV